MNFRDYLYKSRNKFENLLHEDAKNSLSNNLFIVLGNESSDMDSFVCSLTWGYFKTLNDSNLFLPISCTTKELFALRGDCLFICDLVKISYERDIIFINDFQIALKKLLELKVTNENNKSFTLFVNLVDQPGFPVMTKCWLLNLQKIYPEFQFYIEGIVDHHKPDPNADKYIVFDRECYKRVQICGSNTTNIAEAFHEKNLAISDQQIPSDIKIVYFMLLSTILIDTKGLDVSTGKVTEHDTNMVEWLSVQICTKSTKMLAANILSMEDFINKDIPETMNCANLFLTIEKHKNSYLLSVNLTPELALMKDFKIYELNTKHLNNNHDFQLYGISTVEGMSMNGLKTLIRNRMNAQNNDTFFKEQWKTLENHMKNNMLDWMYIICAYNEESLDAQTNTRISIFKREFIAIVPSEKIKTKKALKKLFGKEFITRLKLILNSRTKLNKDWEMWYFDQQDTTFSRKTLQPLLHAHIVARTRKQRVSIMRKFINWIRIK